MAVGTITIITTSHHHIVPVLRVVHHGTCPGELRVDTTRAIRAELLKGLRAPRKQAELKESLEHFHHSVTDFSLLTYVSLISESSDVSTYANCQL